MADEIFKVQKRGQEKKLKRYESGENIRDYVSKCNKFWEKRRE